MKTPLLSTYFLISLAVSLRPAPLRLTIPVLRQLETVMKPYKRICRSFHHKKRKHMQMRAGRVISFRPTRSLR